MWCLAVLKIVELRKREREREGERGRIKNNKKEYLNEVVKKIKVLILGVLLNDVLNGINLVF